MEKNKIQCLGFIMDGNRRWAKEQGLPSLEGHKRGAEVFENMIRFIRDAGIPHAIFYGFSSENWNRGNEEVSYLLNLFIEKLTELGQKINDKESIEKKVRFRFVGDLKRFPVEMQTKISQIENDTKKYVETTIWIALSYGGRAEIVTAVNEAIEKGVPVSEESFGELLWTAGMPDPDLIVRTGGQQRLSNYLPWQSIYSELLFIKPYWPELTGEMMSQTILDYSDRQRNFGK